METYGVLVTGQNPNFNVDALEAKCAHASLAVYRVTHEKDLMSSLRSLKEKPHFVLIGSSASRDLRALIKDVKKDEFDALEFIVIRDALHDVKRVTYALWQGAIGYIDDSSTDAYLQDIVQGARGRKAVLTKAVATHIAHICPFQELEEEEVIVLDGIEKGLSLTMIAKELKGVSMLPIDEKTVQSHIYNLLKRFQQLKIPQNKFDSLT